MTGASFIWGKRAFRDGRGRSFAHRNETNLTKKDGKHDLMLTGGV